MKKFYLLVFTAFLVSISGKLVAQTYTSIANNPFNLPWSNAAYWTAGIVPPNPCTGCTIQINSDVALNFATEGAEVDVNGGSVQVTAGVNLTINTYIKFTGTSIIVGSDATTPSTITLNDQVYLAGGASIQIANNQSYINTNNDNAGNPANPTVRGPWDFFGSNPGVAGIWAEAVPPIAGFGYTIPLTVLGEGSNDPAGHYPNPYTLNCDGNNGGAFPCTSGYIFGPVITGTDATKPKAGIVFLQTAILPVELVQFLAAKNADGSVKVAWATSIEVNAGKYNVERSSDKGTWTQIGDVAAKGNSSITTSYTYTDRTPLTGTAYYRLKMIDLDGKFKYSPVAVINGGTDNQALVIYRNPFIDQIRLKVNVNAPQILTLTVTDMLGKNVISQSYNASVGDNFINLTPHAAPTGMYLLRIQGSTYSQTVKLAKD